MKTLFLISLFLFSNLLLIAQEPGETMLIGEEPDSTQILPQEPTDSGFPDAERVLVIYATNVDSSDDIKDYYVNRRNIPSTNTKGLDIPPTKVYPQGTVNVVQGGEDIQGNGNLGWRYVKDVIADPIEDYLNTTYVGGQPLSERIRYIVLCKGIPLKIRSLPYNNNTWASQFRTHASVSAILCLINQPNPSKNILQLYNTYYNNQLNPLFGVDANLTMDYHFKSNHFVNIGGWYTQYLVSWLNSDYYAEVFDLIERSADPNLSGDLPWIIDDDPHATYDDFSVVNQKLLSLNIPTEYDDTEEWLVGDPSDYIMGYVSNGVHTAIQMPATYILNTLLFNYTNGASFNSWESFNGWSFGVERNGHGLISDFIHKGGTGGTGNVYEPFTTGVVKEEYTFPSYAMGYSIVDAQYQGLELNAWRECVVGDPLTKIYNCENTVFSSNTTIGSGDYDCDVIVPLNVTLTIESGATVNFNRNAELKVFGNLVLNSGAVLNFNGFSKLIVDDNGTLTVGLGTHFVLKDYSRLQMGSSFIFSENFTLSLFDNSNSSVIGDLVFSSGASVEAYNNSNLSVIGNLVFSNGSSLEAYNNSKVNIINTDNEDNISFYFYDNSILTAENITLNENSNIHVLDNSNLIVNETLLLLENTIIPHLSNLKCKNLFINEGCVINFQYDDPPPPNPITGPKVTNEINIEGNLNNPVSISFDDPEDNLFFSGSEDVNIEFCNFTSCGFHIVSLTGFLNNVNILNCNFNNSNSPLVITKALASLGVGNVQLKKISIDSFGELAVNAEMVNSLLLDSCTIINGENGILIRQVDNPVVSNISIDQVETGITVVQYMTIDIEDNNISITSSSPTNPTTGISIDFSTGAEQYTYVKGNSIVGGDLGVQITNGSNVTMLGNYISNSQEGMIFSNADNIECINNLINNSFPIKYSGIFLNSSSGNIRDNDISGYTYGIWLANSSPYLALNRIYNNQYNGIYIGEGSSPYMNQYVHKVSGCEKLIYPFSGFNRIYENGGYTDYPDDDGSEIYFFRSYAFLEDGYNTIADDREPDPPTLYNTQILMNGSLKLDQMLYASSNYWGYNPLYGGNDPGERFGDLNVEYEPYLTHPCDLFLKGICGWIITDRGGNAIDTLYPAESSGESSELDMLYSQADNYYSNNQLNEAKNIYNQIISNYGDDIQSINAFSKLLSIAVLQQQSSEELEQLRSLYIQNSSTTSDSTLIYMLEQLARLTLVAKKEYENVIEQFDEIVQQYPGTERALYAEIDAYTTALLLEENGLNKNSKYSLENSENYGGKLKELLKSYLDGEYQLNSNIIPNEFNLYQNYPNPFNPITTIRYDLPTSGNVELVIFDILGRKVTTIINEHKHPGMYEAVWDASNVASGIYIYQVRANDFVDNKKMILLK